MNILLLSAHADWRTARIREILESAGDSVTLHRTQLTPEGTKGYDWGVSYSYQHLLKRDVLANWRCINLHCSYLPWNRGADPNLWSWIDDTVKGATIHLIDPGIDTGPIYCQSQVEMSEAETLASSYDLLHDELARLLRVHWKDIRDGRLLPIPQVGKGSIHYDKDRPKIQPILDLGHDVRIRDIAIQDLALPGAVCTFAL